MKTIIKNVRIIGLFKYLDYDIPLTPEVNIMHGINGKGKTTILNIITNVLNGDLTKFYQLSFKEITISFNDENYLKIYRQSKSNKNTILFDYKIGSESFQNRDARKSNSVTALVRRLKLKPLLLPAQRVSLQEAYNQVDPFIRNHYLYEKKLSDFEANVFQPDEKMVNVLKIKDQIIEKARRFSFLVNQKFSNLDNILFEDFFQKIFFEKSSIVDPSESKKLLEEIKKTKEQYFKQYKSVLKSSKVLEKLEANIDNTNSVTQEITSFLKLYLKNIEAKKQFIEAYLKPFNSFEKIINELFEGKKLSIKIDSNINDIFNIKSQSKEDIEIGHLSSGEKNLLLIFYHFLFAIDSRTFFMIDEPELSLHIDWQYHIIRYFKEYSRDNQILVVTHSPDILQGYKDSEIDLENCKISKKW